MHSRVTKDPKYFEVIGKTWQMYRLVTVFAGWSCWFLSYFLCILPDPLSSIIGRCTLQDESIQVTISKLP